jgi:cell division septation protein DedD
MIKDSKMKDEQKSDDELLDELDTMYQRVADLQGKGAVSEQPGSPYEYTKSTDGTASTHGKVVSSFVNGTYTILGKPFKKKPGQSKKWFYRRIFVIPMSLSMILFALILILAIVKSMNTPRDSNLGYVQPSTVASPSELAKPPSASPSVPTEQEAPQNTEESAEKRESISLGSKRADNLLTQNGYYAIQVGAFHNWENTRDLMEAFGKKGLNAYWISRESRKRGILYRVFVGRFPDRNEAAEFARDRRILRDYPGSFIRMISPSEINHYTITHPPDE